MNIKEFMAHDHKECDRLFAIAESAAASEDWDTATQTFNDFIQAMERHLGVEENELFPAFEEATGMTMGPTEMMRSEHDQMRVLFAEMRDAMERQHSDDYLGISETLLILMQQHNMKEEQILYNMMDQHLTDDISHWQQKFQDWDKS
ncbi:MAG: hemerythrin domain-containing protein [Gammaproteobacteria bacterium]|nr:hemerythrin domain-containing protein [Gammaproteobacteria bacterium]MCK5263298.1 hemerythrin domain-containing protein [Gammaproteobacteria bacterium]